MDVPRASSSSFVNPGPGLANPASGQRHPDGQRYGILILSEVRLVRETLAEALGQVLYLANIEGVASFEEASARMDIAEPALVLIDATLRSGLAAARRLRRRDRTIRLIAFNIDNAAQEIAAWTEAGIVAYVGRSLGLREIVAQIGTVLNGQPIVGGSTMAGSARNFGSGSSRLARNADGATARLTAREDEVVRLIIAGETNKEIARLLDISVATVKSHVHNLLGKLELTGRCKLALRYEGRPSTDVTRPAACLVTGTTAPPADPVAPAHTAEIPFARAEPAQKMFIISSSALGTITQPE